MKTNQDIIDRKASAATAQCVPAAEGGNLPENREVTGQVVSPSPCSCIVKRCSCGEEFGIIGWLSLPFSYREIFSSDEFGPATSTEYRHCYKCGSTIGLDLVVQYV